MPDLSRSENVLLGGLSTVCLAALVNGWTSNGEPLFASLAISGLAFAFTYALIRWTGEDFIKRGYKGRDLSKKNSQEIPAFGYGSISSPLPPGKGECCRSGPEFAAVVDRRMQLASYGFAYGTLASIVILGILDDSFDMRWRHKFFIPAFAALPMLGLYLVDFGVTHVVVPVPLRGYVGGELIDLGVLYYLYMAAIAIFCPNSINILAGVNGIEVGQSLVIAFLIALNDMLYLLPTVHQPHPAAEQHLFSVYLLLPFIGGSLALLKHNWFPAKVFVGDTYCYFAGMVFAVVGILGHFSKTLLLLLIPQIFNFCYSAPQILGVVPCPRHRLPRFNARTGLLEPSVATFTQDKPLRPAVGAVLKMLHKLKLMRVVTNEQGRVTETSNFTILNLWLVWRGPMKEDRLAMEVLAMQTACGLAGQASLHRQQLYTQQDRAAVDRKAQKCSNLKRLHVPPLWSRALACRSAAQQLSTSLHLDRRSCFAKALSQKALQMHSILLVILPTIVVRCCIPGARVKSSQSLIGSAVPRRLEVYSRSWIRDQKGASMECDKQVPAIISYLFTVAQTDINLLLLFPHDTFLPSPPTRPALPHHHNKPLTPLRGFGLVAHTPFRLLSGITLFHDPHHSFLRSRWTTLPLLACTSIGLLSMVALVTAATLAIGLAPAVSATAVLAHFMVQNSYAYDVDEWKTDMSVALGIGIDGFALNWIAPDCQPGLDWMADRIDNAYTAAEQVGFKLVHSFDMSIEECDVYWNQTYMQSILERNAGSSAAFRWNSNLLVTTYGGDMVQQYGNNFFQSLKDNMKSTHAITLAPALTKYSMAGYNNPTPQAHRIFDDFPAIDGYVNWQAWPLNEDKAISITPDKAFQAALKSSGKTGPYIMSELMLSLAYKYKNLNDGNPLDSWVSYSDTLFSDRFEQLTSEDEIQPDIIELLTWNDFCESHYLRDLPSRDNNAKDHVELGSMGNYVWGQSHSAWRIIAKYYISWWKTGSPPEITQDQVVFWHRINPKAAICEHGPASGIKNAMFPEDAVFAWALVKSPATISMSIGSNQYWMFQADNTGPAVGSIPFPDNLSGDGATPEVAVMRDGALQHWAKSSVPVTSDCTWQNFNPVVGLAGNSSDL
nr:udp-n-acetylglucosamine--dolichyl-phosphate n-acetylglucosaminephosphotransferase [Quercus suber]